MTNFDKLARWDADYYKSLPDDDCIVCLSEKQVYLLGQVIEQLTWAKTRWTGDKSGLDFDAISGDLNYRLSERMTCEKIGNIFNMISQLQVQVANLTTTVNNYIDPAPDIVITANTPLNEAVTLSQMVAIGTTIDGCDIDDKDALYGAINQVVRYIVQVNADFLESLTQAIGNLAEQAKTLLSAFPPTDLLAADDLVRYINFLIDELLEEYNATVTEDLIQQTICDLFCIAVASNCHTNMYDISNYFGSKVSPTFSNFAVTYANLVQFGIFGTFSGDMYFHYLCYFQLASAALGDAIGLESLRPYEYQIAAGQNSPDNDWSIFCIDCPQMYREIEFDFSHGLQGWVVVAGTYEDGRIRGAGSDFQKTFSITYEADPSWRIRGIRYEGSRNKDTTGTGNNGLGATFRVTAGSDVGAYFPITGQYTALGDYVRCGHINTAPNYATGVNEIRVFGQITRSGGGSGDIVEIYCDKVILQFEPAYAPEEAYITEDSNLCD